MFEMTDEEIIDQCLPIPEQEMLDSIDAAVRAAERKISLVDAPDESEDPEGASAAYEEVYHCDACLVRAVMELVWEPTREYIDALRSALVAQARHAQAAEAEVNRFLKLGAR